MKMPFEPEYFIPHGCPIRHESFMKVELMSLISEMDLGKSQFEMPMEDYHDILEMRPGR